MRKKTVAVLALVALSLIVLSSIIATSQAGLFTICTSEFVGYEFKGVFGAATITYRDASGAPNLIISEATHAVVDINVTIGNRVYRYPDDIDYKGKTHLEFNAITGAGFVRAENKFTFKNLPGKPTITDWLVSRLTGFRTTPDGTFISPQEFRTAGDFQLTGTKTCSLVEGFGQEESYFLPSGYTNLYAHHFGLIKGGPFT